MSEGVSCFLQMKYASYFRRAFLLCASKVASSRPCLYYRLLETDSKSLRSMNGSRRNSGSSLVSSSSASSNLSHLEEDTWILWGRIVNEWEEVRKKKEKQLKVSCCRCEVTGTCVAFRRSPLAPW